MSILRTLFIGLLVLCLSGMVSLGVSHDAVAGGASEHAAAECHHGGSADARALQKQCAGMSCCVVIAPATISISPDAGIVRARFSKAGSTAFLQSHIAPSHGPPRLI